MGIFFSKKKEPTASSSTTGSLSRTPTQTALQEIDVDDPEYIYLEASKRKLYDHLPSCKVKACRSTNRVALISGPSRREEMEEQDGSKDVADETPEEKERAKFVTYAYGRTISTYPWDTNNGKKEKQGSPVCDRFSVMLFEERYVIVLADGCNWGLRPREAALRAINAFVEYVTTNHSSAQTLKNAAELMLHGFSRAHKKIAEGKEDIFEAGTTTLLASMLVQVDDPINCPGGWAFVCVTVGDCKAFHYDVAKNKVLDVTYGNRLNVTDARDPGGRLGPYLDRGAPDLRNLRVYFEPCNQHDLLLLVSDGLHDNFDPQQMGIKPSDLNLPVDSWETMKREEAEITKSEFRCKHILKTMFNDPSAPPPSHTSPDPPPPTKPEALRPDVIASNLLRHCTLLTQSSRDFMEQNPNKPLPHNYQIYPGKMDHTTCVVLKVTPVAHM
jgi:hypothetical protein